jgi:hypothetical protein
VIASGQSIIASFGENHTRTGSIVFFHHKQHPRDLGAPEVEAFLTDLAVIGKVFASTRIHALSALLFLYRDVLDIDLPWMDGLVRAKPSQQIPVVLSVNEIHRLLVNLERVDFGDFILLLFQAGRDCSLIRVLR